jgi:hypothetical protein
VHRCSTGILIISTIDISSLHLPFYFLLPLSASKCYYRCFTRMFAQCADTPRRNRLSYSVSTFYHSQSLLVIAFVFFTSVRSSVLLSVCLHYTFSLPFFAFLLGEFISLFFCYLVCFKKYLTLTTYFLTSHFSFIPLTQIDTPTFFYFIPIIP